MPWKPVQLGPYRLDDSALVVTGEPTLDDAASAGEWLRDMERRTPWFIGDWFNDTRERFPETWPQAVAEIGYTRDTCEVYGSICRNVPPTQRLYADELPFAVHQAVAPLDWPTRKKLLKKAKEEQLTVSAMRQEVRLLRRRTVSEGQGELKGRYRVIYADPPWPYDDSGKMPGKSFTRAEDVYPTMSIDEIAGMSLEAHAQPNAALFLWVPVPLLPKAFPVIEAWSFTYKNKIVWSKGTHVHGHYLSNRHEDLILATRGSCVPDRLTPMIENVQVIRQRGENSEKPKEFRPIITRLYDGPYLELFARHAVEGWTTFGNQVGTLVA